MNRMLNIGVAQKIGTYSDGDEAPASTKWVFTAGSPASMLLVVPGLVKPEILVEIEAVAAKESKG